MQDLWTVHKRGFMLHGCRIDFSKSNYYQDLRNYVESCKKLAQRIGYQSFVMCHTDNDAACEYLGNSSDDAVMWKLQVPVESIHAINNEYWEWILDTGSVPDSFVEQRIHACPDDQPRSEVRERAMIEYHAQRPSEKVLWADVVAAELETGPGSSALLRSPIEADWVLSVDGMSLNDYINSLP